MNNREVTIVPPEKFENLTVTTPKNSAVGFPAITSSIKHIASEMGLAKGFKLLAKMNQQDGFDCPGCAWPDPKKPSALGEYCENGAKAIAEEATDKRISPDFFSTHSVEELSKQTDYYIGKLGRLTTPMYLPKGSSHYQAISWEDAFTKIGEKLNTLTSPNEASFYTSGRTSNEAAFMYQLLVRQFGTNNLPDCSNMCHESSGSGLSGTVGIGKGSVTLEDLHEAEVILIIGQNPGTNHPRMLSALEKCKKNGGKIVTVNPLNEAGTNTFVDPQSPMAMLTGGTKLEDLFLQVKINGDVALLKAVMLLMLKEEELNPGKVFDHDFISSYCDNYDELIAHLKSSNYEEAVKDSGVDEKLIQQLAQLLIEKKKIIICWAMGITQQKNGVDNVQEIVNLLLLKGSIGKPGAGTCPVRGHSNVQGDRTMGIWEKAPEHFLKKLEDRFQFNCPREHGYDVVESIKAMDQNKIKVFIGLGGNFISATPDSEFTGKAMKKCELTVQISTKLNRGHLITGEEAIILPCISRSEKDIQESGLQFVTVENSMGTVHKSTGSLEPASDQLKSEPAIVAGIAKAALKNSLTDWNEMINNYDVVRNHIEATINGFDNFNKKARIPGGFSLPNGSRTREFNTPNKRAQFTINELPKNNVNKDHFVMMTIRTHDQYNTTIYGMDDRYRGILNERRVILMNPNDMKKNGYQQEQIVHLKSHFNGETKQAKNFKIISYNIPEGCLASYFPETNVLVNIDSVAKKSNTPVSKFIEVSIHS